VAFSCQFKFASPVRVESKGTIQRFVAGYLLLSKGEAIARLTSFVIQATSTNLSRIFFFHYSRFV
jgi:hypothetical protein